MRIVDVSDLPSLETTVLGPGRWHEVSQQQINQFADATGDHQWIHVDPERAASGPFGRTIAHGFLTLSLIAPVPVGSRVRLTAIVERVEPVPSGFQVSLASTVECDAAPKPACAAQVLCRFVGPAGPG